MKKLFAVTLSIFITSQAFGQALGFFSSYFLNDSAVAVSGNLEVTAGNNVNILASSLESLAGIL